MRKLTKEDIEFMAKAFTHEARLVPINSGTERNPAGTIVRCVRRAGQTTASAIKLRRMEKPGHPFTRRIFELDPPIGPSEKTVLIGVMEMDEPPTTEHVLELMGSFNVEPADYQDFLAALHSDKDPLMGNVVVVLGSHIVDAEGRLCYPRHIARWKGERYLRLEYQNEQAESAREHNAEAVEDRKRGALVGSMEEIPFAWPHQYRFLVRLKDFS